MAVLFVALGVFIGWLFLNTTSLWVEALEFPPLNTWTDFPAYYKSINFRQLWDTSRPVFRGGRKQVFL
jgi:hypothetical protein